MKMSRVTKCCLALLFALTSVSAVQRLKKIKDLKKINFGLSVPKHSLVLLHWFANIVDVDDTDDDIWLNFDPNSGDYGAHHYGNYEELLDPLPRGYRYYTVGNLYQERSMQLPSYVDEPPDSEYEGENRDRIIIRVREQNTGTWQRIDRVYITQHYDTSEYEGTRYDPDHTYQITTNLLRVIREFSVRENQRPLLHLRNRYRSNADVSDIRNTWGNLACLGLFLFIVIEEKYFNNQRNNRPQNNYRPENNYRPQNNYRPENNRPENNNRPETRQNQNGDNALKMCCRFICYILVLLLFIFFACILQEMWRTNVPRYYRV